MVTQVNLLTQLLLYAFLKYLMLLFARWFFAFTNAYQLQSLFNHAFIVFHRNIKGIKGFLPVCLLMHYRKPLVPAMHSIHYQSEILFNSFTLEFIITG